MEYTYSVTKHTLNGIIIRSLSTLEEEVPDDSKK